MSYIPGLRPKLKDFRELSSKASSALNLRVFNYWFIYVYSYLRSSFPLRFSSFIILYNMLVSMMCFSAHMSRIATRARHIQLLLIFTFYYIFNSEQKSRNAYNEPSHHRPSKLTAQGQAFAGFFLQLF